MAGHSHFKNVLYRKTAQDAKRNKIFTKILREIEISAQAGPDPDLNPALRLALIKGRTSGVPKDAVERAVSRGQGETQGEKYESILYEGFLGSVALLIETLTDNRQRTVPRVRSILTKHGGSLGTTNSAACLFEPLGNVVYGAPFEEDAVFEAVLACEARDVAFEEEGFTVFFERETFAEGRGALIKTLGEPLDARLMWKPRGEPIALEEKEAETLQKTIDALEDEDDVQDVWSNAA